MKKVLAIIISALILASVASVPVSAYNKTRGTNYADVNKDGICDNKASSNKSCTGYIDSDNDGVCDNNKTDKNQRSSKNNNKANNSDTTPHARAKVCKNNKLNFVDSDNDGICDNRVSTGRGNRHGRNR